LDTFALRLLFWREFFDGRGWLFVNDRARNWMVGIRLSERLVNRSLVQDFDAQLFQRSLVGHRLSFNGGLRSLARLQFLGFICL
jgi:hypothetical protein